MAMTASKRTPFAVAMVAMTAMIVMVAMAIAIASSGFERPNAWAAEGNAQEPVGYAYVVEGEGAPSLFGNKTLLIEAQKRTENPGDRYSYLGEVPAVAESGEDLPWYRLMGGWEGLSQAKPITHVVISENVAPTSMAHWFEAPVESMWHAGFTVDMSDMDASRVEDISHMFAYASVGSVAFPSAGMPNLKHMDNLFANSSLSSTTGLDNLGAQGIVSMDHAFAGCMALASLSIGNAVVAPGAHAAHMFAGCSGIVELDVSQCDFSGLSDASHMFDGCRKLSDLDISGGFGNETTACDDAFGECKSLQRIRWARNSAVPQLPDEGATWTPVDDHMQASANIELKGSNEVQAYLQSATGVVTLAKSSLAGNPIAAYYRDSDTTLVIRAGKMNEEDFRFLGYVSPGVVPWKEAGMAWSKLYFLSHVRFEKAGDKPVCPTSTASWFESLGAYNSVAFEGLDNLDTSSTTDMSRMFANCLSVQALDLSSFDTSNVTNMSSMFAGCAVESLDLSSFDTSSVANHADMFTGCERLSQLSLGAKFGFGDSDYIELPDGDWTNQHDQTFAGNEIPAYTEGTYTRQIEDAGNQDDEESTPLYAVRTGDQLTIGANEEELEALAEGAEALAFPRGVQEIKGEIKTVYFHGAVAPASTSSWFGGWESLEYVDCTGLDLSQATNMRSMFDGCTALKSVDLSVCGAVAPQSAEYLFRNCTSLQSLDLSTCDFSKTTSSPRIFYNESVTYKHTFEGCNALKSVKVGPLTLAGRIQLPTGMWQARSDDMVYRADELPADRTDTYERVAPTTSSYAQIDAQGTLTVAKTIASLPDPAGNWLYVSEEGYESADNVPWSDLRESVKEVHILSAGGVVDISHWFADCTNLTSVDVSGLASSQVYNAVGVFENCTSLETADLSGLDIRGTETQDDMVYASQRPADVSVASLFEGCSNLKSVTLPDLSNVTVASRMFRCCTSLESLDLSGANTTNVRDYSEMFRYCTALRELDLSGFNTFKAECMMAMLHGCTALQQVKLGKDFTFRGCGYARLSGSEFPDGAWVPASGDGTMAYASDSIPCVQADSYTRLADGTLGVKVQSIFENMASGNGLYTETAEYKDDGSDGVEVELSYEVADGSSIETLSIGESAKASSVSYVNAKTISRTTLASVRGNVSEVTVGPNVSKIRARSFTRAPLVKKLTVKSKKLASKASIYHCLRGSNVRKVIVDTGTAKNTSIADLFHDWAW